MPVRIIILTFMIFLIFASFSWAVPTNGLVGYWAADGNTNDSSGNSNHGTGINIAYATGKENQAFNLNGTTRYVSVGNSVSLDSNGRTAMTVAAWIKPTATTPNDDFATIVEKKDDIFGSSLAEWSLQYNGTNPNISFIIRTSSGSSASVLASSSVTAGNWFHLAGVYDGSAIKIYVNGVLEDSASLSGAINDANAQLSIGAFKLSSGEVRDYFNGLIDETVLYNRALSLDEIQTLAGIPVPEPSTLLLFSLSVIPFIIRFKIFPSLRHN